MILLIAGFCGCGISQGKKREKLQYLNKLNTQAAMYSEFSNEIENRFKLELYKDRLNKLRSDLNAIEPVAEWDKSLEIKQKFIGNVEINRTITDSLIKHPAMTDTVNYNSNSTVLQMRERSYEILQILEKETSVVDKE